MLIILLNMMSVTATCCESPGNVMEFHGVWRVVTLCGIKRCTTRRQRSDVTVWCAYGEYNSLL